MKVVAFNYSKLKGKLAQESIKQKDLAKYVGISENIVSKKLNEGLPFKAMQIIRICKFAKIPIDELSEYFFNVEFD